MNASLLLYVLLIWPADQLIAAGAGVNNVKDRYMWTRLQEASYTGDATGVKHLLAIGANVHAKDKYGQTPLHLAAGEVNVMEALIAKGADVNAKDEDGDTPLHVASYNGDAAAIELLLAKGANVHAKDKYGQTPLHWVSINGDVAAMKALIAKGADVHVEDKYGWTPLHHAASYNGDAATVELLLFKGADVHAKDNGGNTPRDVAASLGRAKVLEVLDSFLLWGGVDFAGPQSDFTVAASASRFALSAASTCANADEGLWTMSLRTDDYPWETAWTLTTKGGDTVASGPPTGRNYARATKYIGQMCLKAGRYNLNLFDKNGDGFCCTYGNGNMNVKVNGRMVATTQPNTQFSEETFPFRIRPSPPTTSPPTAAATPPPTSRTTPLPTDRPAREPVTPPTNSPTKGLRPSQVREVRITFETDRFGAETSYKFTRVSDGADIVVKNDLQPSATSVETVLIPEGRKGDYRLTVLDAVGGLKPPAYYSVTVDGEEVVYGSSFGGGSATHIIKVGFVPPLTQRDREWLDKHNSARADFYAEETPPLPPRDLVWSPELAAASSAWIDQITPDCKIRREPGLKDGENMANRKVMKCLGRSCAQIALAETPAAIMGRWVNNKRDKDYPANQSATQVWWRGTRYVGCAHKAVQFGSDPDSKCFVSICRYARAGNCGMGRYPDWKTATLTDRTPCGPDCPGGECY